MGLEIIYSKLSDQTEDTVFWNKEDNEPIGEGYYYWYCFPGCMPEGDPIGPFGSRDEAYIDAINNGYCNFNDQEFSIEAAPAYWASYLINGDSSGLEDSEITAADEWIREYNEGRITDVIGEPYFGQFRGVGCDLANYVVQTTIES